jgi:sarcosine oxidase
VGACGLDPPHVSLRRDHHRLWRRRQRGGVSLGAAGSTGARPRPLSAGHDRGSSHGETRVIRQAYFEHPDYVPLLLRAYELWRELEAVAGLDLLHQVGLLQVGPPEGHVVRGVLESASRHGLAVERLDGDEVHRRFAGFHVPEDCVGVFEPAAGYLRVEQCVLAHCAAAKEQGAELRAGVEVRGWRDRGGGAGVVTDQGEFRAAKLIVTAGPWAPQLLAGLGVPFEVRRKHAYWFPTGETAYREDHGCPTYLSSCRRACSMAFRRSMRSA